ncbi:acyl-CoA dehydrogenase family protein [Streptomyces sp. NPDC049577]|uniref:acyl-CoA dehydrogenase family protein n=1 Tax=Streptomyces sp. NPDC049577 TaxID=3155153 RepID=UPI003437AE44
MEFRLDADQRAVQKGARELLASLFPRERLRAVVDGDRVAGGTADEKQGASDAGVRSGEPSPRFLATLWRELGAAGFFSLRLPEKVGGAGLGLLEVVLVLEEAGRVLLPGPLVASQLAAGHVAGAGEGATVVTAVERHGTIEYLGEAQAVLFIDDPAPHVLALPRGEGPHLLGARPVRSVDPTTPLHTLADARGSQAAGLPPGVGTASGRAPVTDRTRTRTRTPARTRTAIAPGDAGRLYREAALLTAAQQLGSSLRTMEMTIAHVRVREQFGRPIGAFQAVQHLCAQMLVRTEIVRSAVYAAALTITACDIAAAKVLANEAAVRNARDAVQLHGGLGFTWDADVHLHLKRAWLRAEQWGRTAQAEEELAAELPCDSQGCV